MRIAILQVCGPDLINIAHNSPMEFATGIKVFTNLLLATNHQDFLKLVVIGLQ